MHQRVSQIFARHSKTGDIIFRYMFRTKSKAVLLSMCLNAIKHMHIECNDHIHMESGHSQMECDSMHSTIESTIKKTGHIQPDGLLPNCFNGST